jgi:hypothetical protein
MDGEAPGLPDVGTVDGPAEAAGADPDGTTAGDWQLCMRLLTAKSAMRAIIARIARPTVRRLVKSCMAGRVYVEGSAG